MAAPDRPTPQDVRAQLDRILNSAALQGSPRRRDLLRYLVDETLAGRGERLKGYAVALAVFDRDQSFDPSADPVVRLEAGRLRRALDSYYVDAGRDDRLRITIPKGAYVAHFAWATAGAPAEPVPPQAERTTGPGTPETTGTEPRPRRRTVTLIAALVALALLAALGLTWGRSGGHAPVVTDLRGPALIVLPFQALDSGETTRLFADAMTQDLIFDLMRFPDFRLFSEQDSFGQQPSADPVALGRDLGVSYVLRGTVQSGPGKLRLGAQLVDATSGEVVWSGSYDRSLTPNDLIGMRSDLSSAIATALGEPFGVVSAATAHRLTAKDAPGMASYNCVLRAYAYRRTFASALFAPALDCLRLAVLRDPDYADAWAMLGWLNLDAVRQDQVAPDQQAPYLSEAYDAATRAVTLDPGSQRGLEALSAITFFKGDFALSEQMQRKALALNPNDPEALAQLGWRLAVRGNWDAGLPFLQTAIERSANPPGWYFHLIAVHAYLEGNHAEALSAANRSARYGSAIGLMLVAISLAELGDSAAARDTLAAMATAWPLLARDPATALQKFQPTDQIVDALIAGLRKAGWTPPETVVR